MIIGTCQNLIRGQRDDWIDARYCGAPTIDLGIPSERNICQTCRQHSQRFIAGVVEHWVAATTGDAGWTDWTETAEAIIADMSARLAALRASRAPLSRIYLFQRDLDRRIALYRRVTGPVT